LIDEIKKLRKELNLLKTQINNLNKWLDKIYYVPIQK
jgi:hypothetical protein